MASECRYIRQISAMCDGELELQLSTELSHHLDECDKCREEYQRLLRIKDLLYRIDKMEAPQGFAQKFKSFRNKNPLRNWQEIAFDHLFKRLLPLSLVVLAVILIWMFFFSGFRTPETIEEQLPSPDSVIIESTIPDSEKVLISEKEPKDEDVFRLAHEKDEKKKK